MSPRCAASRRLTRLQPSSATPAQLESIRRRALPVVAALVVLVASATSLAQNAPSWVYNRADGAYVEAFSYPSGMTQAETAIMIVCDLAAPAGINVVLWIGDHGVRPTEVDVLVRRDQDAIQRYPWFVGSNGDRASPMLYADVERFLDDLRRGGTLALRFFLLPGVPEASQPTFQYAIDGFAEIEQQLRCDEPPDPFAALPAAPDPFATPSPPPAPPPIATSPRGGQAAPATVAPPAAADPPPPPPPPPPAAAAPPATAPAMTPPAAPPAPPAGAVTPAWSLDPNGLQITLDATDREMGFFCIGDDEVIAYFMLPTSAIATDTAGAAVFTYAMSVGDERLPPDDVIFFDLGDGLYATDVTSSLVIMYSLAFVDAVRVSHAGATLFEVATGLPFDRLVDGLVCILDPS